MQRIWRSGEEIADVVRLIERGMTDRDIARGTGIPAETIRAWRRGRVPERARRALAGVASCANCGGGVHDTSALPRAAYAYLLGLYLGDGCIAFAGRGSYSLRVASTWRIPESSEALAQRLRRSRAVLCRTRRVTAGARVS